MPLIRNVLGVFGAATSAALAALAGLTILGEISTEDVFGFGVLSFVAALLLATFIYLPILSYGRRRWGWGRGLSILLATTLLNIPVWLVLIAGHRRGLYGGWSEVLLFAAAFTVAALVFSLLVRPASTISGQ